MVILIKFIQNFASTREYLVSVFPLETAEEFVGVEAERNAKSETFIADTAINEKKKYKQKKRIYFWCF